MLVCTLSYLSHFSEWTWKGTLCPQWNGAMCTPIGLDQYIAALQDWRLTPLAYT